MTLIEAGCIWVLLVVPCCVGAFVADEHGGWGAGIPAVIATFLGLLGVTVFLPRAIDGFRRLREGISSRRRR